MLRGPSSREDLMHIDIPRHCSKDRTKGVMSCIRIDPSIACAYNFSI